MIQKLYELAESRGIKFGLQNMLFLDKQFDFPSHSFLSVHVAGTNGKGSTTYKIARSLQIAGRKVGIYTSPHISTVRERVQVNGQNISEGVMNDYLQKIFSKMEECSVKMTFFEVMTLLSFLYFRDEKVDVAVIEVGMGGQWDATNIITPLLSIITSIGYDHKPYLGNTLEDIAYEKGGIIKKEVPLLLGPTSSDQKILHRMAALRNSPCFLVEEKNPNYEEENCFIARKAMEILPFKTFSEEGLLLTPPCRFEFFSKKGSHIILDVAHNPPAVVALLRRLKQNYPKEKWAFVVGFSGDKEVELILESLKESAEWIYLTRASHKRAYLPKLGEEYLKKRGFHHCSSFDEITTAFENALKNHSHIVATGTFYIMKEVRDVLGIKQESDNLTFPF